MDESMRPLRGSLISYVPQDPGRALNPSLRIAGAIEDIVNAHRPSAATTTASSERMLETVELPASRRFADVPAPAVRRPAAARARSPSRCHATRPLSCSTSRRPGWTSSHRRASSRPCCDCATSRRIAMVYVTHDLAVVAQIADRIAVMYAGTDRRAGQRRRSCCAGRATRTRAGCIASIPDHARPRVLEPMPGIAVGVGERAVGLRIRAPLRAAHRRVRRRDAALEPIDSEHEVRCFHLGRHDPPADQRRPIGGARLRRHAAGGARDRRRCGRCTARSRETVVAAADISFAVARGACVALVGESGSGKTTIARAIAGLHPIVARPDPARRRGAPEPGAAPNERAAAAHPTRVPEPSRSAQSPPHGASTRLRRPAPPAARHRSTSGARRGRPSARVCAPARAPRRPLPALSSRAVSASASRSPERSRLDRT